MGPCAPNAVPCGCTPCAATPARAYRGLPGAKRIQRPPCAFLAPSGAEYARRAPVGSVLSGSVTRPNRFVTVRIGRRAISVEKSRLQERAPTSVNVTVGSAKPLRSLAPRSSRSNRWPRSLRVLSAQTYGRDLQRTPVKSVAFTIYPAGEHRLTKDRQMIEAGGRLARAPGPGTGLRSSRPGNARPTSS
jgi:hypothetical protein